MNPVHQLATLCHGSDPSSWVWFPNFHALQLALCCLQLRVSWEPLGDGETGNPVRHPCTAFVSDSRLCSCFFSSMTRTHHCFYRPCASELPKHNHTSNVHSSKCLGRSGPTPVQFINTVARLIPSPRATSPIFQKAICKPSSWIEIPNPLAALFQRLGTPAVP